MSKIRIGNVTRELPVDDFFPDKLFLLNISIRKKEKDFAAWKTLTN